MIFAAPLALYGLLAAAAPVTIYFLLRRRKSEVPWGASYLLRLTLASRRKSSIWKQIVVLTVRTLILLFAALLIARPFRLNPSPSADLPALPLQAVHRLLLIDNSLSMGVDEAGQTRLARLQRAAIALIGQLRVGDTATLITLLDDHAPQSPSATTITGPVSPSQARKLINAIQLREGVVDLEAPLATAFVSLSLTPGALGEIHILSDFPRELDQRIESLAWVKAQVGGRGARLIAVSLASPASDREPNIALQSIDTGTDLVLAGHPVNTEIQAANLTDTPATAVFMFTLNGREAFRQPIEFQADEYKRFQVPIVFPDAGPAELRVSVDKCRIDPAASRDLALTVRDKLKVWVVADRRDDADPGWIAQDEFLFRAVSRQLEGAAPLEVVRKSTSDLGNAVPPEVDLVCVAGPRYATPAIREALTDHLRRGGGVIHAMTPNLEIDSYNEDFLPLLPGTMDRPALDTTDPDNFLNPRAEPESGVTPGVTPGAIPAARAGPGVLLADLALHRGGDLPEARVYNFMRFVDADALPGVVWRLSGGEPWLFEKKVGRGRMFTIATTVSADWTSLPVRQGFLPLLHRLAQSAVEGRTFARNLPAGSRAIIPWGVGGETEFTLTSPGGERAKLRSVRRGEMQFGIIDTAPQRGLYRLSDESGRVEPFTVRGDLVESDVRTFTAGQSARWLATTGSTVHDGWPAAVRAIGPIDAQLESWPWLLSAMLLLYLFETWFVQLL